MPQYDWTGTKKTGEVVSGVMTADSKDAVSRNLQRQNIMVTKIKEKGKEFALPSSAEALRPRNSPYSPGSSRS